MSNHQTMLSKLVSIRAFLDAYLRDYFKYEMRT